MINKTVLSVFFCLGLSLQMAHASEAENSLAAVLQAQSPEMQARYDARNPQEVLGFFGLEPGMTVVEGLPGGGWYSQILMPYLGSEGELIGADYSLQMYPLFGFFNEEQLKEKETWTTDWPAGAAEWSENGAKVSGFHFGSMPDELKGTADLVLMVRALHNLFRFEGEGGYRTQALNDIHAVLKPGGILGVVQHEAHPDTTDEFASGARGYVKKSDVIESLNEAGFELVGELGINQNPKDIPGPNDIVWRLPPTYIGSPEGSDGRAMVDAIGESNRMTLKFRKR